MYYENLKGDYSDYLVKNPIKKEVLENACIKGQVSILPNSRNRAIIIENEEGVFLQSYDTLICQVTKEGKVIKLWNDYSNTTMKHINDFLYKYGYHFSKKTWLEF